MGCDEGVRPGGLTFVEVPCSFDCLGVFSAISQRDLVPSVILVRDDAVWHE